jgi:hypothetical protein
LGPQRAVGILGQGRRAQGRVRVCHVTHLWLRHKARATPLFLGRQEA